jgi:hypothetical protein
MEKAAVFELKKSLIGTLRKMPVGKSVVIKNRDFKVSQVRIVASTLKRNGGYEFSVSDTGRIDDSVVTRLK